MDWTGLIGLDWMLMRTGKYQIRGEDDDEVTK